MQEINIGEHIEQYSDARDEAVNVYRQGSELKQIVLEAPEGEISATTMNVLNQAIEGLVERSGVPYSTLAMESAATRQELKQISVEGFSNYIREVWKKIKEAFLSLVKRVKEYFTNSERVAEKVQKDHQQDRKEMAAVEKEAVKKDLEGKELQVVIDNPNPYILHKSYYKARQEEVTVKFHDLVDNYANYCMKSREHHLLEWVRDFKEDIVAILDKVDVKGTNPEIINEVYSTLHNYVSEDKTTAQKVSGTRKFKEMQTNEEFDSDYGNKRYVVKFGVSKDDGRNASDALQTGQVITKAHRTDQITKVTFTGVEVLDMKHLANAIDDNIREVDNYLRISKEINALNMAVVDMMRSIEDNAEGDIDPSHVVTLGIIDKGINTVSRMFSTILSDVIATTKAHSDLYSHFSDQFKSELLKTQG